MVAGKGFCRPGRVPARGRVQQIGRSFVTAPPLSALTKGEGRDAFREWGSGDMDGLHEAAGQVPAEQLAEGEPAGERGGFVRDRAHCFPGRRNALKVLYNDVEVASVRTAAQLAGLTASGFVGAAGLTLSGAGVAPATSTDRALLAVAGSDGAGPLWGEPEPGCRGAEQRRGCAGVAVAGGQRLRPCQRTDGPGQRRAVPAVRLSRVDRTRTATR